MIASAELYRRAEQLVTSAVALAGVASRDSERDVDVDVRLTVHDVEIRVNITGRVAPRDALDDRCDTRIEDLLATVHVNDS